MNDAILEEVREARRRIFEECGGEVDGLVDSLKAGDLKHKDRLVTLKDIESREIKRGASSSSEPRE